MSKFLHGSSLLMGDATIPGVPMPKELKKLTPVILKACADFGCDFYPTVVQMCRYDEISELAAYGGFPVRYPHWRFGMEYEELQRGYEFGMHKIYEMVINTSPCYIYCLNSNTLADNLTVIAHATGHNHFFKNNIYFSPTTQNAINELANHGSRIRKYMSTWGKERVTEFIDHVLRLDSLIDPAAAWEKKEVREVVITDKRTYRQPRRLHVDPNRRHMENFINPKEWTKKERDRCNKEETADEIGIFGNPTKDILRWIKDFAPLKPWQQDIVSMLYEEALYFSPQGMTKVGNEGFASWIDYNIMAKQGYIGLGQEMYDTGIVDYATHKMGVLGGKYSTNPYKLGFEILCDIEERWNKGRFGTEWDECDDIKVKEKWDKGLGLGKEKVFEVCKYYDDVNLINDFFTEDLCRKLNLYESKWYKNGEKRIESRDYKRVKKQLISRHMNRGLPDIRLADPNHRGRGQMFLQHFPDIQGQVLYDPYARDVLTSIRFLMKTDVLLATYDDDGEEIVYICHGNDPNNGVEMVTRSDYEQAIGTASKGK